NLDLTVNPTFVVNLVETICEGESVSLGGNVYNTSGNQTETVNTTTGCDSVVNLELIVNPTFAVNLVETICEGESVSLGGNVYTTTGNYSEILTTATGCDSIVNLELTVNPTFAVNLVETICEGESVSVGGNSYTTTGNYSEILTTTTGCDSIVNLNLTVNPTFAVNLVETICEGESVSIGGNDYNTSGNYSESLTTTTGCDSIVNLNLIVRPTLVVNLFPYTTHFRCVSVGGNSYTTTGNYSEILTTASGCDSLVTLDLTVNPTFAVNLVETICEGESVSVGGNVYTTSGNYSETLTTATGCDSLVNLELIVNPTFAVNLVETICEGESVSLGGNVYNTSGNYSETLTTTTGCDSIVNLELTVNPTFAVNLVETICEGESVSICWNDYK